MAHTPVTVTLLKELRHRQGRRLHTNAADIGIHRDREIMTTTGSKRFTIKHNDGHLGGTIIVREFDYHGEDGDFAATIWIGNTNAGQEADAMLNREETVQLIAALSAAINRPLPDNPEAIAQRVTALADKWHDVRQLGDGAPSVVARAFADELRRTINGA